MVQFIPLIIIVPLIAFYLWMFRDMSNNDNLPPCFINLTNGRNLKFDWTFAFIFLNILTAGYYYFTSYRQRH
jgi:hypothetical protein